MAAGRHAIGIERDPAFYAETAGHLARVAAAAYAVRRSAGNQALRELGLPRLTNPEADKLKTLGDTAQPPKS